MQVEKLATVTNEASTGRLRYRPRKPSEGLPGRVLQQEVRTWTYEGGNVSSYSDEWRDVPFVPDAE